MDRKEQRKIFAKLKKKKEEEEKPQSVDLKQHYANLENPVKIV